MNPLNVVDAEKIDKDGNSTTVSIIYNINPRKANLPIGHPSVGGSKREYEPNYKDGPGITAVVFSDKPNQTDIRMPI